MSADSWTERAACKGVPTEEFFWWQKPAKDSADKMLAYCAVCPVLEECAQDLSNTGDKWPYQVRAGRRLWTSEADTLPSPVVYSWEPPKQQVGGDPGPLPAGAFKSRNHKPGNPNPHTRGPWNTPTPTPDKDDQ